jgi:hypothetical protein
MAKMLSYPAGSAEDNFMDFIDEDNNIFTMGVVNRMPRLATQS